MHSAMPCTPVSPSTPVRVDWDGNWHDMEGVALVVEKLVEAGVFFVTIDGGYLGLPGLGLRRLFEACSVTVRARPEQLDSCGVRELLWLPPALVLVHVESEAELEGCVDAITTLGMAEHAVGVCFVPARDNIAELPGVIELARRLAVRELHLPNPNLVDFGDRARFLSPVTAEQHEALARAIEPQLAGWPESPVMHIHDGFLWRLFHPGAAAREHGEMGGCQAAAARVHISPEADVHACNAMPMRIGNLREASLQEIYELPSRRALRARIEALGVVCTSCVRVQACQGGCRGLAWLATGSLGTEDPNCVELDARVPA